MQKHKLLAAIFDWGNTLCDYPLGNETEQIDFLRNFLMDSQVYSSVQSNARPVSPDLEVLRSINRERDDFQVVAFQVRLKKYLFPRISDEDASTIERKLCNRIFSQGRLIRGASELLSETKSLGIKIAILSNTPWGTDPELWRSEILRYEDISHLIENVVLCHDCGFRKPNPKIFRYCLDLLSTKPSETIMIGDSFQSDIEGATKVGCEAIWFSPSTAQKATYKVIELNEIAPLLKRMQNG